MDSARDTLSFGPFSLIAGQRLLTRDGTPVEVGARALDVLIVLLTRPNQVIDKKRLLAEIWPGLTVSEGSLRFHIVNLRKALGDGKDGARYITTVPGRGYCFVAPVSHSRDSGDATSANARMPSGTNLPPPLARMVGRTDGVAALSAELASSRLVTIVGPGGVGKTTLAVAVAHDQVPGFDGAVLFTDLAALDDASLVPTAVASLLGLSVRSSDPTSSLAAYLRDKRMLLVLDNCEHVIEAAAALANRLLRAAPQLHILATSREALRVEDEHVHRLSPLACPPDDPALTVGAALTYPAVELFVERAAANGTRLHLDDGDARIVASICRKLDGVALAIELAAGSVSAYGLQETGALLDRQLGLLRLGQRTAPLRQRTLLATLDWSYGLLSEVERVVLRRLAVFVGEFTIEAALAIVTSSTVDREAVLGALQGLVAKSMVATHVAGATISYRLLATTRAYAAALGKDDPGQRDAALHHAAYCEEWLKRAEGERQASSDAERLHRLAGLNNVRAALDWCFGTNGEIDAGIRLAAAAVPMFLAMSLLTKCYHWCGLALQSLPDDRRWGSEELRLQAGLGLSLMFMRGDHAAAQAALERSLAIAEDRDDILRQLALLAPLHMLHVRVGSFRAALDIARRSTIAARTLGDAAGIALAHCLLGVSLQAAGRLGEARAELEAALHQERGATVASTILPSFDHRNLASIVLARTLWLQGHSSQALEQAGEAVGEASRTNHPLTLAIVLHWAASVFLWAGSLRRAEEHIDRFITHAEVQGLEPYRALGRGL